MLAFPESGDFDASAFLSLRFREHARTAATLQTSKKGPGEYGNAKEGKFKKFGDIRIFPLNKVTETRNIQH